SVGLDQTIRLWDTATGQLRTTLKGHTQSVYVVDFSPDGKLLASATGIFQQALRNNPGEIKLWEIATGKELAAFASPGGLLLALRFSPDGKTLASAGWDKSIRLWDVPSQQLRATLMGSTGGVRALAFSPDGKTLATGGYEK